MSLARGLRTAKMWDVRDMLTKSSGSMSRTPQTTLG